VHGFWRVEEVAGLVGKPTVYGEGVRGGHLFAGTSLWQGHLWL